MAFSNENPMIQPFLELWNSYAEEMTEATEKMMGVGAGMGMDPSRASKQLQQRWLDAVSDSMEEFLRTPQFLEWMRHHSDMIVKVKEQSKNLNHEFARNTGIPTANDISGLFERIHSVEEAILSELNGNGRHSHTDDSVDRLELLEARIMGRLDQIEQQVEELASAVENASQTAELAAVKPAARSNSTAKRKTTPKKKTASARKKAAPKKQASGTKAKAKSRRKS